MSLTGPVSRENYHYANGDFFVTSTNQNRHRRAPVAELNALFHPQPGQPVSKDPPAHWYRAQLLHYGLQPSDNKGTAAKRLLDAVNRGDLQVPDRLRKLEQSLKKEWDANERKTRRELVAAEKEKKEKGAGAAAAPTAKKEPNTASRGGQGARGAKRKADGDTAANGDGGGQSATSPVTAATNKKTKVSATTNSGTSGTKTSKTLDPKASTKSKARAATAKAKSTASKPPESIQHENLDTSPPRIRPKQWARRSKPLLYDNVGSRTVSNDGLQAEAEAPRIRTKQTARRSKPLPYNGVGSRKPSPPPVEDGSKGKMTAKKGSESKTTAKKENKPKSTAAARAKSTLQAQTQTQHMSPSERLPSLGLINGRYEIDIYGDLPREACSMSFCLEGKSLWGEFRIGAISGIMFFPDRPWRCARRDSNERFPFAWRSVDQNEQIPFTWRGHEPTDSDSQRGFVAFLGDGGILGNFENLHCRFSGNRISGTDTKSGRPLWDMKREWECYAPVSESQSQRSNSTFDDSQDDASSDSYPSRQASSSPDLDGRYHIDIGSQDSMDDVDMPDAMDWDSE